MPNTDRPGATRALQHNYPGWQDDPHAEDSNGESREVWQGAMRVVSAKRARVLRKRGVPLMPLHVGRAPRCGELREFEPTTPNGRARYAWFEPTEHVETRQQRRRLQCYLTATTSKPQGRKAWLRTQLVQQREAHATRAYIARGMPSFPEFYERAGLYCGVPYENVLNPQLDLYAEVARQIGLATPEQLEAAKAVDMSDFHEGLKRAKLAEWERTRYAKPLLDPSYAGAPHADCDCMACRPYTG